MYANLIYAAYYDVIGISSGAGRHQYRIKLSFPQSTLKKHLLIHSYDPERGIRVKAKK